MVEKQAGDSHPEQVAATLVIGRGNPELSPCLPQGWCTWTVKE
jgi:hypothetical protein